VEAVLFLSQPAEQHEPVHHLPISPLPDKIGAYQTSSRGARSSRLPARLATISGRTTCTRRVMVTEKDRRCVMDMHACGVRGGCGRVNGRVKVLTRPPR
jgi:hypothetical protein